MKKALIYWFGFLLILLAITSCGCKKIPINTITTNDSILKQKSTVKFTNELEKSLAINDAFQLQFPKISTGATNVKYCDSLCNEKVKEALANINIQKDSGDNGYKIWYDKFTNQLKLTISIGETIKQKSDSIAVLENDLRIAKTQVKEIPVVLPLNKWQRFFYTTGIILWILIAVAIGWKIYKIINQLKLKS